MVGTHVGEAVVGAGVGDADGCVVGTPVGEAVGARVGEADGWVVGVKDGWEVGAWVGIADGWFVGLAVVGAGVG